MLGGAQNEAKGVFLFDYFLIEDVSTTAKSSSGGQHRSRDTFENKHLFLFSLAFIFTLVLNSLLPLYSLFTLSLSPFLRPASLDTTSVVAFRPAAICTFLKKKAG